MSEIAAFAGIKAHQKEQRQRIVSNYIQSQADNDPKAAEIITKAQFDELYSSDKHEIYSLASMNRFREDIMKAEGIDNPEQAFVEATKDLKSFVIHNEGKKAIVFVRKKEKGE